MGWTHKRRGDRALDRLAEGLNANIPTLHVWVRREFLTGGKESGIEEGYAFAIMSVRGRALQFHVMLKSGAHFRAVPLHMLWTIPGESGVVLSISDLQLWDCFSSKPVVTVFDFLRDHECKVWLRDRSEMRGTYLFTVDWLPDSEETPGLIYEPDQNKCGHVIALANGQIACQPTNRIAWMDSYFIGANPKPEERGYVTNGQVWRAEMAGFDQSQDDGYFYGVKR